MTAQDFLMHWVLSNPEDSVYRNGELSFYQGNPYVRVRCPLCEITNPALGPDKSHHCHVHEHWFRCQRCGAKGPLQRLLNWNLPRQQPSAPQRPPPPVNVFASSAAYSSPGACLPLQALPLEHVAWQYLLNEKFTLRQLRNILEHYPIYYCREGKQFTKNAANTTTNRLIFAITEKERQIGWQARWLPPQWPPAPPPPDQPEPERYLTSPGLKKSYCLYNIDRAMQWDTIIVVEGIKKVWKTGPYSVATLGIGNSVKNPQSQTNEQFWMNRLREAAKEGRRIRFLYDRSGLSAALNAAAALEDSGADAAVIPLPSNGPDDLDNYTTPEITHHLLTTMGTLPKKLHNQTNPKQ